MIIDRLGNQSHLSYHTIDFALSIFDDDNGIATVIDRSLIICANQSCICISITILLNKKLIYESMLYFIMIITKIYI